MSELLDRFKASEEWKLNMGNLREIAIYIDELEVKVKR